MPTGIDWEAVEGDSGGYIYFTVYDCNGVAEDISGHTVTLKVWSDDAAALKFSGNCTLVGGGTGGICRYIITATDFVIGDEGIYFFTLKLDDGAVVRNTLRGELKVSQGAPV